MFQKILIANRGEIACRVIKTAHRLGIRTVAVYSAADQHARHVRLADEAVAIGPAPARESYLCRERIIDAAASTGAQAIHPGYGFLSENADFAEACERAGLVFIGPPAAAIRAMGSKRAAKALLQSSGVSLVPGYHGDDQAPAHLQTQAERIGYPLLIKASAGGGGKGMRVVTKAADFESALSSCQREAASSFGDETVLLEKFIARPRHIEIQVFADQHGTTVYLGERDCSVQRRHQKIIEEAPAPGMTPARRAAMGAAAVAVAKAVGYVGAGTVEFIAEPSGAFYFMEMNTRLQVEHPVTEMITGLDLVEWQLRVAAGEPLPLQQSSLSIRGHAIEARIYAEDPAKNFLPSPGRLTHLTPPAESSHVRVDTGAEQGDVITPYYDPMIAKLIVWDETRERACARMLEALAAYRIVGVANNIDFLARLVASPAFASADLDTGLIEREHALLFAPPAPPSSEVYLLATLAEWLREHTAARSRAAAGADPHSLWQSGDGWRLNSSSERRWRFRIGGDEKTVVGSRDRHGYLLTIDNSTLTAHGRLGAADTVHAELNGTSIEGAVIVVGDRRHVFLHGRCYALALADPRYLDYEAAAEESGLRAPMPGKITALLVAPGAVVERGTPLLVLEAMKMEHTITAPAKGKTLAVHVHVGEQVDEGKQLIQFEPLR